MHPGEHLAEELRILNMSASELARRIKVPTNRVTQILNGRRAITGDTALRLAHFFGTRADFWLNLQSLHELRLAEEKVGEMIKWLPTLKLVGEGWRSTSVDQPRGNKRGGATSKADACITDWIQLIRAEYLEIPDLCLTKLQVQRLWGLDPLTSDSLLEALVEAKFLRRTGQDTFVRARGG
jgi:addiction module HigA family antidote